jgi:hypothetical protein
MVALGKAAVEGDPIAKPFLDADAIRISADGTPSFHKDRFLKLLADQMSKEDA